MRVIYAHKQLCNNCSLFLGALSCSVGQGMSSSRDNQAADAAFVGCQLASRSSYCWCRCCCCCCSRVCYCCCASDSRCGSNRSCCSFCWRSAASRFLLLLLSGALLSVCCLKNIQNIQEQKINSIYCYFACGALWYLCSKI